MVGMVVTLTGIETHALAPYLAELHPLDLEALLSRWRFYGDTAKDWRSIRADGFHPYALTPDAWDERRQEWADTGAACYGMRNPRSTPAERQAYGSVLSAATEALRSLYLGDNARADAALDALKVMGCAA